MCGRFTLTSSEEQISAILPGIMFHDPIVPRYNVAPTQPIAAIANDGSNEVRQLRWGLIPSWAKDASIGSRMINARAESVADKPSYRTPLRKRRCLILADGFYEWKKLPKGKGKTPMYVRLRSGRPFAFAGLWDRWRSPDGEDVPSATIITTDANELLADVHDRMPVILAPDAYDLWLSPREPVVEELLGCLKPYPSDEMEMYAVSTMVNKSTADEPACIEPVSE